MHEADRGGTDCGLLRCGTGSVFECAGGARFFRRSHGGSPVCGSRNRRFLAGAAGGCQAEIGSASAMAAGGVAYLLGGGADEIANAAALALKNLLGLACDPVAGLVEVPCVKRNVMGAVNAMTSADMTMAGIFSKIPPDEVIDAMRSIGRSMNEDIRETGKGGLAGTPTGVEIRDRMAGTL
mgnify:CR=1 FL=1